MVANNRAVLIYMGNNDGTFQTPITQPILQPEFLTAYDFNGDGKTDLIGTSSPAGGQQTATVYLSQGNGVFQSSTNVTVPIACGTTSGFAGSPALGDLNGDGKTDFAFGVCSNVVLMLSQPGGSYTTTTIRLTDVFNAGSTASVLGIAIGDMNGDSKPDLVVNVGSSMIILLGNGAGQFQAAGASYGPLGGIMLADFNRDGIPDALGADGKGQEFGIALGNGDGTLQPLSIYGVGGGIYNNPAVADFNKDGIPDLVFGTKGGSYSGGWSPPFLATSGPNFGSLSILLGNGDGTFTQPPAYSAPLGAGFVVAGDWNGDGKADLAVTSTFSYGANATANSIEILLSRGDGTFEAATTVTVGQGPTSIAVGDFNGDQKPDLAVANITDNTVSILLNDGSGGFTLHNTVTVPVISQGSAFVPQYYLAAADFNGDGKTDIAIGASFSVQIAVLNGDGTGNFTPGPILTTNASGFNSGVLALLAQDFNGDGAADLMVGTTSDIELFTTGGGTFSGPTTVRGAGASGLAAGDLNGDSIMDLAVSDLTGSTITAFLSSVGSAFAKTDTITVGAGPREILIADYNGDGKPDLAVGDNESNNVAIVLNTGNNQFAPPVFFPAGMAMQWMTGGDFNGDSKPDLAVADSYDAGFFSPGAGADGAVFELLNATGLGAAAPVITTIGANAGGLTFSLDGTNYPAPQSFILPAGAQHTIAWQSPQTLMYPDYQGPISVANTFQAWANGNHDSSITLAPPAASSTLGGNFVISGNGLAILLTPAPGGPLPAAPLMFTWSAAPDATMFRLDLGSTPGGSDLFSQTTTGTSLMVNSLAAGSTVYARLSSEVGGTYYYQSYVFYPQLTSITIATNPVGLQFTVNGGQPQTAPQTFMLAVGSTPVIAVGSPQAAASQGTQYVFTGWSDDGAASHSITVGATAATYTASFKRQYQLTIAASPTPGGTVTPASGFFDAGSQVPILANANPGYQFSGWSGNAASMSSASTTVTMSAPESVTANFTVLTPVTLQTTPAGLLVSLDNMAAQAAPITVNLAPGAHTVAVASPQAGAAGTQYVFTSWSDGGAPSHQITLGTASLTLTAAFQTQYQLTVSASPAAGGTVTPATGFFDANSMVPVAATANEGYVFNSWTGPVVSPSSASTSVTMSGAATVTANFSALAGITIQTAPPGLAVSVDGGAAQAAPVTANLTPGSHTISVAATQAGSPGTQYVFTSWSDGGAASHGITVGANAATYTATFQTQYQLTTAGSSASGGTVTPASGAFYNSGAVVNVTATAATGYVFTSWSGPVANSSSAATIVAMNAPETVTANFSALVGTTIQTTPAGLLFTVDGGAPQIAPQVLNLALGQHTIAVAPMQAGGAGTQYVFASWSDGGAASHSIAVGAIPATYTATFQTQYQLTTQASPASGGTVMPASGGFYNAGTAVNITAAAAMFYVFTGWTGSVASASSASTTVSMTGPETVVAEFLQPDLMLSQSSISVAAEGGNFTVNVTANLQTLTWTATSNASFLAITSGAPGMGNGTVGVSVAANTSTSSRTGTLTIAGQTFTITQAGTTTNGLGFYPVTPCRVVDTRAGQGFTGQFGPPSMTAGQTRSFTIPSSGCNIPTTAQAYSLNVTVVPPAGLGYLTIWPAGQTQPYVSTLNSLNGAVLANATIVPAGTSGAVSVYVTDASDVIIDINGYFAPSTGTALAFYPVTPCRIADTRNPNGPFGGPSLGAGGSRSFVVPSSSCDIPATAQAYALNVTAIPPGPLEYLTVWPTGRLSRMSPR